MKIIILLLINLTIFISYPLHGAESGNLAYQVGISLLPPNQTNPELPPKQLTLVLTSPKPIFYKLDLPDKTLAAGRLIIGKLPVGLPWKDLETMGRVPLTLSVIDQNVISKHEFCLIFTTAPVPVDLDGIPLPTTDQHITDASGQPHITFDSHTDKHFEELLRDIRATPAPERPYELVDKNIYNRMSFSPVNMLLFAAVHLVKKLLSRKPDPLSEISCRYSKRLETGQEWITMRVSLINQPLPETRPPAN